MARSGVDQPSSTLGLLRRRNYALLWWAALVSGIGNYVLVAALPYFVYAASRSTLASGTTLISEMIPMVIFASVGGIFADRWRRKPIMVASDVLRAIVLLPLLAVHSTSTLWIVYVTAFLGAAVAHFAGPFGSAAVPHVVAARDLPTANAAFSAGGYVAALIGSALGGVILQHAGLHGVVVVDALTFVISAALVSCMPIRLEDRPTEPTVRAGTRLGQAWQDWLIGVQFLWRERWLRLLFIVMMVVFLGNATMATLLAPFVRHILGESAQAYAWMLTAQGLGGIAASVIVGRLSRRTAPAALLTWSISVLGTVSIAIAIVASMPLTLAGMFLAGVFILFGVVSLNSMLQARVPDRYRGRVYGTYLTASALASLLGATLASFMGDIVGIRTMFAAGGAAFLIGAIVGFGALLPAVRQKPLGTNALHPSATTDMTSLQ